MIASSSSLFEQYEILFVCGKVLGLLLFLFGLMRLVSACRHGGKSLASGIRLTCFAILLTKMNILGAVFMDGQDSVSSHASSEVKASKDDKASILSARQEWEEGGSIR